MEAGVDFLPAGDSCTVAPSGIQIVLEVALAASSWPGQEVRQQGTAPTHLAHGHRECNLGAPRIHGELKMLGFNVSERTVLRWMRKAPRRPEPSKRWAAFLNNHRVVMAAMDFFTVPTLTFGVLYCFFVIAHDRRQILHCNVTRHPSSAWVVQQLREAFPCDLVPGYLIFDRATNFNEDVISVARSSAFSPSGAASGVHGKTALLSAGLATAAGICSTM
jgi:hypothetical protein